jgi:hypothetical protein
MNHLVAANKLRHPHVHSLLKPLAALAALILSVGHALAAGGNSVSLAWDPNPETDVVGYRLQYGTVAGVYPNFVDAGAATSATVNGLNQGTTYHFTVVAYNSAGQNSTPSEAVTYTVPGTPNTAPLATASTLTVAEDGQAAVVLAGTDTEGDALVYSIVTAPTKGTLTGTPPNLTYRPAANATGADSFTFRANDGALDSAPATVAVTITPQNDAPTAGAVSATVAEDGQVSIVLAGADVDGDSLSYTIVSAPTKGTLSGTAPSLIYRPAANLTGSDSFTYRVNDGTVNSGTATVSITISPVNDLPVANAISRTTNEDTAVAVVLSGSDIEGSALTYTVLTQPAKGVLSGTAPNLTYTPAANANGSDSFTYRVNDGSANSPAATVSLTITPVNDAPVANPLALSTPPGVAAALVLSGSDVEGSALTYAIVNSPTKGSLSGTAPNLTYTPNSGASGADSFTFRVNDGTANSATATVSITIAVVNQQPVANPRSITTNEDTAVAVLLTGSDPEGGALSFAVLTQPTKGTLSGTPPNLTYTPAANANGSDSFTYRVNDGNANSAAATVSLTISPVNDAPVANPRTLVTNAGTAVAATVSGSDVEGSALSYAIITPPKNGTLSGTGPNYTYTPAAGFTGADSFSFRVSDGALNSTPATVSITVNSTNLRPLAHGKSLATMRNKATPVVLSGFDGDGNPLTFRIISQPSNGTITGTPPNLVYRPAAKWSGEDVFTYVANDGTVDSPVATVRVKVKTSNKPPVATARALTVNQNTATGFTLTGTDADGDPLTYAIAKAPKNGRITGSGPSFVFIPNQGFKGTDRFSFTVRDGIASSKPVWVTVTVVNPNNRAPLAVAAALSGPANKPVAVTLSGTDSDSDPLTFRLVSRPGVGKLAGKGSALKYVPPKGFTGMVTLTYVASDGLLESAPATISITITEPLARRGFGRSKATAGAGDSQPLLSLATDPARPGTLLLTITGSPGSSCTLEHSEDLAGWTPAGDLELPESGVLVLEQTIPAGAPRGFFRLNYP